MENVLKALVILAEEFAHVFCKADDDDKNGADSTYQEHCYQHVIDHF